MAKHRNRKYDGDEKSPTAPKQNEPQSNKDNFREFVETIVFVVVLVVMLKMFLAEAFVIPTGSMAPTLYGYHMDATCEQCGYPIHPNAAREADPQGRLPVATERGICGNCHWSTPLQR